MSGTRTSAAGANQRPGSNRGSVRAQVVPTEIKGILTAVQTSDHLPFLVWDVSREGLGLWIAKMIAPGERVKVAVGHPFILVLDGEVMWCDEATDSEGYRCGVAIKNPKDSLGALYEHFGG